jgi:hypothetical protein
MHLMNIIKGFKLYIELIRNIMILPHIWIENPDIMCIKGCWNNQNNNDYTTRIIKYKFKWQAYYQATDT